MMEYDDIIKLDNEDFLIVDELEYNGRKFLYVQSIKKENDISIVEEYVKNDKTLVKSVEDSMFDLIMSLFSKKILNDDN